MRSPIDGIENVRASVDDVERQMQACQAAGVQIPPNLAWRLLSECRSLLGRIDTVESALSVVSHDVVHTSEEVVVAGGPRDLDRRPLHRLGLEAEV